MCCDISSMNCNQAISPSCHFDPLHIGELLRTCTTVDKKSSVWPCLYVIRPWFFRSNIALDVRHFIFKSDNLTLSYSPIHGPVRQFPHLWCSLPVRWGACKEDTFLRSEQKLQPKNGDFMLVSLNHISFVTSFVFIFWPSEYLPHVWWSQSLHEPSSPGRRRSGTNTHPAINSHTYSCADTYSFIYRFRTFTCWSGTNTLPAMNSQTYSRTDTDSSSMDSERQQRAPMRLRFWRDVRNPWNYSLK